MEPDLARLAWIGRLLVPAGVALGGLAAAGWALREWRAAGPGSASPERGRPLPPAWLALLGLAVLVGAAVRLAGLDAKGVSHPEIYIPGVDLPAGISEPPPRHGLAETASWHFWSEPHPFGYYLAMWAWTKVFGASLVSIRLPEAILGALSVPLVFWVGRLACNARVGVAAAALLALHGFHVFWSQMARMYAPGAFLGLLSTGLLLASLRGPRARPGLEAAYVAVVVAGALTVEFFWPVLAFQMLWVALQPTAAPRTTVAQALAFVLAAPILSHALMLGREAAAPPPTLGFLAEYLSFGFLLQHGAYGSGGPDLPLGATAALAAGGGLLAVRGMASAGQREAQAPAALPPPAGRWPLPLAAVGGSLVMLGVALVAGRRNGALAVLALLPLALVAAPALAARLGRALDGVGPAWLREPPGLVVLLGLAAPLAMFAASFAVSLTARRAFLVFVPYVLVAVAAGVLSLGRRAAPAVAVVLALAFTASTVLLRGTPTSVRAYDVLAAELQERLAPGDLILAPARHWAYTPLFFYLDPALLVGEDHAQALRRAPDARVWVLAVPAEEPPPELVQLLGGYRAADRLEATGLGAVLYAPPGR